MSSQPNLRGVSPYSLNPPRPTTSNRATRLDRSIRGFNNANSLRGSPGKYRLSKQVVTPVFSHLTFSRFPVSNLGGEPQTPLNPNANGVNLSDDWDGSPRGPIHPPTRQPALGQATSATTADSVATDRVLAGIANLKNHLDSEMVRYSDTVNGEIAALSLKIDRAIETLNVKVDRVTEHVEHVANLIEQHISHRVPPQLVNTNVPAPAATGPWAVSTELRDRVYFIAYEKVFTESIEAYTARESTNGGVLASSLFNTILRAINDIDAPWPAQQLPRVVNGIQDVRGTRLYHTVVKSAGKHARERLHHLLLHNIRNPRDANSEPEGTVPNLKSLVYRIANHCPRVPDGREIQTLWDATSWGQRLRIAYLRREALRITQTIRRGEATPNIWKRVDTQLNKLRNEGELYSMAFYKLVYNADRETFNGHGHISAFDPAAVSFDLPSEVAIGEQMDLLEVEGATTMEEAMAF